MKSRRAVLTVLVLAIVVTVVAYVLLLRPTRKRLQTVKIGTFSKALSYTPLYVAKHFNWFQGQPALKGLQLDFNEFNDRPAISAGLAAGDLHLLFCAEIPAIMISAQGERIRIIKVSSTATQRVLVRSDSKITAPADLRGKRVAVLQGTSSHYCLLKILQTAGLKETDAKLSYMTPNEARAAFESKQLDGWAVWAPFGEQQEVRGTGREIGGQGAWIHSILAVPESVLEHHADIAEATAAVLQRAKDWIAHNPDQAQRIAADALNLDLAVVKQGWPKFNWNSQLTADVLDDIQQKADFLAELDKTRQSRRVDIRRDLIAPNYLPGRL